MTYPKLTELLGTADPQALAVQRDLLVLRQSVRAQFVLVMYFVAAIIFVYAINYVLRLPAYRGSPILNYVSPRWLAIGPLGILAELLRRHFDKLYVLSTGRLTKIEGRLSLRYNVPSVRYGDVKGIVVEQTFWGRVLGFGDVLLGTAAQDQNEMTIQAVSDPYGLAELIEELVSANLRIDDPRRTGD